jgi:DNA-binding Lrp family transcriptional regulator
MDTARYNVLAMIHALVMIKAEREAMHSLGGKLADVEGVSEAFSVTGEWDFVAILRLRRVEDLAELVTGTLSRIRGIRETHTMVAFEVYSQHDLEAMFSIGA